VPCPSAACPRQIGSGLCPARRCDTNPPPPQRRTTGDRAPEIEQREVAMTRRVRLWVAAVLIAASGLMAAVAITATTGVNHTPAHAYLAGIVFNGID
jgi:hypothetical protein